MSNMSRGDRPSRIPSLEVGCARRNTDGKWVGLPAGPWLVPQAQGRRDKSPSRYQRSA